MVDKNKPSSWRPYKKSLCLDCWATCCTMPLEVRLEDLVRLEMVSAEEVFEISKKDIQKIAKRLQRQGLVKSYRESTGLFLLESLPNGDCRFLDQDRRCKVYDKRPGVCRQFPETMGLRLRFCPYLKK